MRGYVSLKRERNLAFILVVFNNGVHSNRRQKSMACTMWLEKSVVVVSEEYLFARSFNFVPKEINVHVLQMLFSVCRTCRKPAYNEYHCCFDSMQIQC